MTALEEIQQTLAHLHDIELRQAVVDAEVREAINNTIEGLIRMASEPGRERE